MTFKILKPIANMPNLADLPALNSYDQLFEEDRANAYDQIPVFMKLFTPRAGGTWFITEGESVHDGDDILCFGLCDLGMGFPELGYVSLKELMDLNMNTTPVEVDKHYKGSLGEAMDEMGITWHRRSNG